MMGLPFPSATVVLEMSMVCCFTLTFRTLHPHGEIKFSPGFVRILLKLAPEEDDLLFLRVDDQPARQKRNGKEDKTKNDG